MAGILRKIQSNEVKMKPGQKQEYQLQPSQDSESSCFWCCLEYMCFLNLSMKTYIIKILSFSDSDGRSPNLDYLTYEMGVVAVEGNQKAEKVTDRDNELKKLIEGEDLQIRS